MLAAAIPAPVTGSVPSPFELQSAAPQPLPATSQANFDATLAAREATLTQPNLNGNASHYLGVHKPWERVTEEAQKLIDLGNAVGRSGPRIVTGIGTQATLGGTAEAGAGTNIDLTSLNRAYDFAMRTYLMSKVVSEVSSGLKSLWQAQ
jgi:hypothetical protein